MKEIATALCVAGILGLFYLDRDPKRRLSAALWIPVMWLWIIGSRPVSVWFSVAPDQTVDQLVDGSPLDRNVFLVLTVVGAGALLSRQTALMRVLRASPWVVIFLLYCGLSIAWSDFPAVSFKRWIKFMGDHIMVLLVLTDPHPLEAVKRVFARVGFILLPVSLLFINYYPQLGRAYASHWVGTQFFTGVATDKNMLGVTCMIFGLGASWRFVEELSGSKRFGMLVANGFVAALAARLLWICDSKTSLALFAIGAGMTALTAFSRFLGRPPVVHFAVLLALLVCVGPLFLGLGSGMIESLGRDSSLSGRTELWTDVLNVGTNPLVGTGFESFWLGPRLARLWAKHWWGPIEAHNGYLEIYINLGWIGIVVFTGMVLTGYRTMIRMLHDDPAAGHLRLGLFVAGLAYNLTEAAVHTSNVMWVFLAMSFFAMPKRAVAAPVSEEPVVEPVNENPWMAALANG